MQLWEEEKKHWIRLDYLSLKWSYPGRSDNYFWCKMNNEFINPRQIKHLLPTIQKSQIKAYHWKIKWELLLSVLLYKSLTNVYVLALDGPEFCSCSHIILVEELAMIAFMVCQIMQCQVRTLAGTNVWLDK